MSTPPPTTMPPPLTRSRKRSTVEEDCKSQTESLTSLTLKSSTSSLGSQAENASSSKQKSSNHDPSIAVMRKGATHSHPMFLGSQISASQLAAVHEMMEGRVVEKVPSFYGCTPATKSVQKQFPSYVTPQLLGAAECHAESNHPVYSEIATHCVQRQPFSVLQNAACGTL